LVVGARQAAAMRRAAAPVPEPLEPDIKAGPGPDLPVAEPVGPASATEAGTAPGAWIPSRRRGGRRRRDEATPEPSFADNPPASDEALASPTDTKPRVANREDAEAALAADAAYHAEASAPAPGDRRAGDGDPEYVLATDAGTADADPDYQPAADHADQPAADPAYQSAADPAYQSAADPAHQLANDGDPDYRRASSVIGAARTGTPGENAWRRPPDQRGDEDHSSSLAEEFAEPDADDPDDEPLPQSVRPADAVRVARMPAEVLVVDGRPRYHMADCPHLVGRLTEPLPAAEAVELGFSPCGLCRPVDRLVARAAQR
jgi:hypothetical protein